MRFTVAPDKILLLGCGVGMLACGETHKYWPSRDGSNSGCDICCYSNLENVSWAQPSCLLLVRFQPNFLVERESSCNTRRRLANVIGVPILGVSSQRMMIIDQPEGQHRYRDSTTLHPELHC